ncbi:MAG: polysaccharide biosynthesis tyrosine autokinase [Pirellulales bacterium]
MSEGSAPMDGTSPTATATGNPNAGMLAPLRDTGLSPLGQSSPSQSYGGADPLAGGIDYRRAWHAFRRRWLPATALALALASIAGILTWVFLPKGFESVAWLRVRDKSGMFGVGGGRDNAEYEAYRKTQVQLIKSPFVLTSALRRPGISSLSTLSAEDDPVGYLMRNIQVSAPMESEVVQVRMRGEDAKEVTQIVNAVAQAYLSDVVNKEKSERLNRRDTLERKYKENMAEVRSSLDTYNNLAKSLGTADTAEVATQRSLLLDHLGTLRAQLNQTQRDLTLIDAELAIMDAKDRGEISLEQSVPEETVDAMLLRDPQFAEFRERLSAIEESMAYQAERSARGGNDPAVKRLEAMRDAMMRRLEDRKEELRPQIVAQLAMDSTNRRTGAAAESPVVLRMRREILAQQLEQTTKDFDKVASEVKTLGAANADLMSRKQEIEQLMKVTDQMGVQLNATEIDVNMPNRVELIEEASVPEGSDELFRSMLSALAALGGLVLGGGSVVLFEYLRDRVSIPEEVSQRVGLRVIGTVPQISRSRKRANDGHVAECVDGIRAVISQTGREAPKVILVTSAVEHEGKTTFAAQLAASLARSGKRTLLLDGDLRHPNAHLALGLDLRAGLPELLRGEISPDEAVQPTAIDGLFAVTGGVCDYAAITALSRPETAALLKSLRDSFDHVVIDAGPVLAFADVLLLGQLSDLAIVATMRDVSRMPQVTSAVDRLRSVGIRVLGTVVNGVSDSNRRRLYASPIPA